MGFFDKVKNMFTEEIEDDVKVEQIKKEVAQVSIESPRVENFSISEEIEIDTDLKEKVEEPFSKPIFFDDNDFKDLKIEEKTIEKPIEKYNERELYSRNIEMKRPEEKKVFKPTPIISPVYGVLDKNYHKEDIVSRNDARSSVVVSDVEPSVDSIRNKAYGTLEDELENTLFGNNSILFKQIKEEVEPEIQLEKLDDDVLTNLTDDISKELDELLTKKEKYLDTKEKNEEVTDDLLDFIDSTLYKDGEDL